MIRLRKRDALHTQAISAVNRQDMLLVVLCILQC